MTRHRQPHGCMPPGRRSAHPIFHMHHVNHRHRRAIFGPPIAPILHPINPAHNVVYRKTPFFLPPRRPFHRPLVRGPLASSMILAMFATAILVSALMPGVQIIPLAGAAALFTIAALTLSMCLIATLMAKPSSSPKAESASTTASSTPYREKPMATAYAIPVEDEDEQQNMGLNK